MFLLAARRRFCDGFPTAAVQRNWRGWQGSSDPVPRATEPVDRCGAQRDLRGARWAGAAFRSRSGRRWSPGTKASATALRGWRVRPGSSERGRRRVPSRPPRKSAALRGCRGGGPLGPVPSGRVSVGAMPGAAVSSETDADREVLRNRRGCTAPRGWRTGGTVPRDRTAGGMALRGQNASVTVFRGRGVGAAAPSGKVVLEGVREHPFGCDARTASEHLTPSSFFAVTGTGARPCQRQ